MANDWTTDNMKSPLRLLERLFIGINRRKEESKQDFEWCLPYLDVICHSVIVPFIKNQNSFLKGQMIVGDRV